MREPSFEDGSGTPDSCRNSFWTGRVFIDLIAPACISLFGGLLAGCFFFMASGGTWTKKIPLANWKEAGCMFLILWTIGTFFVGRWYLREVFPIVKKARENGDKNRAEITSEKTISHDSNQ